MSKYRNYSLTLKPDDVLSRLRHQVRSDRFTADLAEREHIVGKFTGNHFRLCWRGGSFRILLTRMLDGRVDPAPEGSLVHIRVGTHYFVMVAVCLLLTPVWLVPILVAAGVPVLHHGKRLDIDTSFIQSAGIAIALTIIGFFLQRFRRQKEEELWNLFENVFPEAVGTINPETPA